MSDAPDMADETAEPVPPIGVVTTVMFDTVDLDAALAFWTDVLGLDVVHRAPPFAYLSRLGDKGPRLAFQEVPEKRSEKNRLHLDVMVPNRQEFIRRVLQLGGAVVGDHQEGDFPTWTVVTDPEGNQFCIYDTSEQADGQ
jgi:catechol 2,3-dioxygenase-like lactoylglutathione lyase family enzyme